MRSYFRRGALLVALSFASPSTLPGQDTTGKRFDAAALVKSLRSTGSAGSSLVLLTQARGEQPKELLDAVADTLATIAIGLAGTDVESVRARSAAVSSLFLAAIGEPGLPGASRGVPYAGAASRLKRVSETSRFPAIRAGALRRLGKLDTSKEFVAYLRQVALGSGAVAAAAVEILVDDRGQEGRAIARSLYRPGTVKDPEALLVLNGAARHFGW